MATKRTAGAAASAAAEGSGTVLHAMSDLPRQQLAVVTETACALFKGFEAIRKIQEEAAHAALRRYSAALEQLNGPCDPADLIRVQGDLLRFDTEHAVQYWQQLGAAAMEMEAEMAGSMAHLVNSDGLLSTAHSMLQAMPPAPIPSLNLFATMMRPAVAE